MRDLRLRWGWLLLGTICPFWMPPACGGQETLRLEGVNVSYSGISQEYARAIGRTVAAARSVAAEQFGFDMPQTITVSVTLDPQAGVRLFNDGQDRLSLTVRSEQDLRQPSASGIFHLYGLCHEVGHLAMYRPIRDHSWMTSAAAEGWAHYLGSRIVDEVYAREGKDLWPDPYDYISDGMKRLQRQLASPQASPVTTGAGLWKDLQAIVGDKGLAPIFVAWGKTSIDTADPAKALGRTLLAAGSDERLVNWWKKAEETLILKRPTSSFSARTVNRDQLVGQPRELAHDDGRQAGRKSSAGGGHAVRFQAPGDSFCVTSVRIYGSRYGRSATAQDEFRVWLCDEDFKALAEYKYPYADFRAGQAGWVTVRLKPTEVPPKFIVCVGFNPTASKGVFLGHDQGGSGNSLSGLPGGSPRPFADGDWMIRVTVDRLKNPAGQPGKTPTSQAREWTDSTGTFQVQAEYLGLEDGKVRLKKADGNVIAVPLERLSQADQDFVRQAQGGKL
jgi:hypothetical protein